MTNNYTTSTDAFADMSEGNYNSTDNPNSFTAMDGFVTAASRLIDREVGRRDGFFYPTTDDKTFYYNGSGMTYQDIDEFASITSVAVAEQGGISTTNYTAWTADTDYLTLPLNASNDAKPINILALVDYNGTKGSWYPYQKAVKVIGVPGYSTSVIDIVALACRMQSIRWFMRAKQGYQDTGASVDMGPMTFSGKLELDPDIRALLHPLKLELDR